MLKINDLRVNYGGIEAVKAARKALDEHSPSKVFYGIGDYAVRGFANALTDIPLANPLAKYDPAE